MILFQLNNMLSHKKIYQYTNTVFEDYVANTVFEDYVANTVFHTANPAYFGQKKCATQNTPRTKS